MDEDRRHRLAAPLEVFWALTGGCNLRCTFCMTESAPVPPRPPLAARARRRILEELRDAGVLKVYLTGGEPMILTDFWELLEGLLGGGTFVELTTNGTLVDRSAARRLAALDLPSLQVSLQGSSPAVNDPLMGAGSFARVVAGIRHAVAAGLAVHVRPTVTAANVDDVPALLDRLAALGVRRVDLTEVSPLGRAATNFDALVPPRAAMDRLVDLLASRHPGDMPVDLRSWSRQFREQDRPALCTLGAPRPRVVIVDEGGHLLPCSAASHLGFENPVVEHGLLGAWERLEALGAMRDPAPMTGACRSCELREGCIGGCRAAAARLTGDPWAPDPLCPRLDRTGPTKDGERAGDESSPGDATDPWRGLV